MTRADKLTTFEGDPAHQPDAGVVERAGITDEVVTALIPAGSQVPTNGARGPDPTQWQVPGHRLPAGG